MKKTIVLTILVLGLFLAACARTNAVEMKNFAFTPQELALKVGDRVIWNNPDVEPHTATTSEWDSGVVDPGKSYTRVFDTPGTFNIHCQFHPDMHLRITVTPRRFFIF